MLRVIGFSGLARSGKTESAKICKEIFESVGWKVDMRSFADPLRFGLQVMGVTKDEHYELYRTLAQWIGTDVLRKSDENWWVNLMENSLNDLKLASNAENNENHVVIIDDIRFENEVELVKRKFGRHFFVYAGDRINTNLPVYNHASEYLGMKYLKSYQTGIYCERDFIGVDNSRSVVDLRAHLENYIEDWYLTSVL